MGQRKTNIAFMWGLMKCSVAGCTVTVKCSIINNPANSSRDQILVYVYGEGTRNHECVTSHAIAGRPGIRGEKRKVMFH